MVAADTSEAAAWLAGAEQAFAEVESDSVARVRFRPDTFRPFVRGTISLPLECVSLE